MVNGVIAVIVAYLLGAIPAAYVITRLAKGQDIRRLGGGNVGARNVFREAGKVAGVAVLLFDVGKGVAAVAIARWLLDVPQPFLLASGLAVVVGHIWSIYLKFSGGNGLATALGVLSVLLGWELLIALAVTVVLTAITRDLILSVNISLLSVPLTAWFLEKSWPLVIFSIVLIVVMVLNFYGKYGVKGFQDLAVGLGRIVALLRRRHKT